MKCSDCPFSLPCFAGRLDRGDREVELCPVCGRLTVTTHEDGEVVLHALRCELRPLTEGVADAWAENQESIRGAHATRLGDILWPDPTLYSKKLRIRLCWKCNPNARILSERLMHGSGERRRFFRRIDYVEQVEHVIATTQPAWSLTPSRQRDGMDEEG